VSSLFEIDAILIYDLQGRKIIHIEGTNNTGKQFEISLKDQPKGIYYVAVQSNGTSYSSKIALR